MQFNFVVSTNERAVRLWQRFEFEIVGAFPKRFFIPRWARRRLHHVSHL